ncbi:hypothetical protein [Entomobacter blattae]|nr:hypothetical protein [Entomobacter blattae]
MTTYRRNPFFFVRDIVKNWGAQHASRTIERHIGEDLQFVRP